MQMKSPRHLFLAPVLLALALSGPRAALADEAADLSAARAAFMEGTTFARSKRWVDACDRYALSLKLHPAALTLYSLGVAQREAGRLVAARSTFEAFLAEPVTPKTQAYTAPARAAIAELGTRIASLAVVLAPAGAGVTSMSLDGVGLLPGTFTERRAMDPGTHEVVAQAPGRLDGHGRVTLVEGGSATLTVTLLPLPASVAGPPRGPADRLAAPAAPWPPALPFALFGVGGAALAGGVALGLVGLSDARGAPSGTSPEANDARAKGLAGDVLAASGIAVVGVGLVLFLVQQTRPLPAKARGFTTVSGNLALAF
jgi:hypothetical protein